MGICVLIADSLCYTAETNTPLESNYTPIKMVKKKKPKASPLKMGRREVAPITHLLWPLLPNYWLQPH